MAIKRGFKAMLAEANAAIETVSVQDLPYLLEDQGAMLVDVRETAEVEKEGVIPNSLHVPRGMLEFHADPESPVYKKDLSIDRKLIVYCGTGGRSALAAKTLLDMGYEDVSSLAGGFAAWKQAKD